MCIWSNKEVQQQVDELRGQVDELRRQLRADSDALLLRELATQTVSKISRKATGCSVWDAHRATLQLIKGGPGAAVYTRIMQQYPLLKAGVVTACSQGTSIAHPVPVPPVTEQILRELISRAAGALERPAAEQVLDCLVELTAEFNEPLFLTVAPPS